MKSIFTKPVTDEVITRINNLTPETPAEWGKMNVAQMLAHLNVTYEMVYEPEKHPRPGFLMRKLIQLLAKSTVVGPAPYKKNTRTAPAFVISDKRDFQAEKKRLVDYLIKTQELGESFFDMKESNSFGKLTVKEWNTMFYKHLDHHLSQFSV